MSNLSEERISLVRCVSKLARWIGYFIESDGLPNPMDLSNLAVGFLRLKRFVGNPFYGERSEILERLLKLQNRDGSWNEIYPHLGINTRSALATAYVGNNLLTSIKFLNSTSDHLMSRLITAADYILSKEKEPGYFIKSDVVDKDTVNVNMVISLFLLKLYFYTGNEAFRQASMRGLRCVLKSQLSNGAFPYYTSEKPYLHPIPYHAFVTRLLAEYYDLSKDERALASFKSGVRWLVSRINSNGRIKWEGDLGIWVYRLFQSYGNVLYALLYASNYENQYYNQIRKVLNYIVSKQTKGGFFPVRDYQSARDAVIDLRNAIELILHGAYLEVFSLLKTALIPSSYEYLIRNVQLLETLTACLILHTSIY